jgi:hypothetical protein
MAEIRRTQVRTLTVRSKPYAEILTADIVRDFVYALDRETVPDDTPVLHDGSALHVVIIEAERDLLPDDRPTDEFDNSALYQPGVSHE